ncbi:hypothetical protein [Streptomyces hoynatensis]|uniref:DUF624 domain-containing protein n=1 Tax=Streptomyces hoynatensis TaxID=1141874 RepID=A0A3A9Z263_9ACTN|nr:hypothetical protein [Streptomyces hoynatensis]RKN42333.1 hypothetical protein D7294_12915 [Streptomyces hoynatensis]
MAREHDQLGRRWNTGFALFGEVLITGVLIAVLCLPLVTALPALAAGAAHLRRHLDGESVRSWDLLRDFATACRTQWPAALGFFGVALLLLWNLSLAQAGVLPGAGGVLAVMMLLLAAWAALLLRTAAVWRPDRGPREVVAEAAERGLRDPAGSALLAAACVMCGVFVWMLLPLALVGGGLLALAAVAVDLRHRVRTGELAEPAEDAGTPGPLPHH